MTSHLTPTRDAHIDSARRARTRVLRALAPSRPVTGGGLTYSNSFNCLAESVPAASDVRKGTWILDSTPPR